MKSAKGLTDSRHELLQFDDVAAMAKFGAFAVRDASEILGLSRRKVLLFVEQGLVPAWNVQEVGRGRHRRLSLVGLFRMYVAAELEYLGYTPKPMKPLLELVERVGLKSIRKAEGPPEALEICSDRSGGYIVAEEPGQCSATVTLNLDVMFQEFLVLISKRWAGIEENDRG
ncbi:MAG: hypothetical protein QF834_07220 [Candidatus Thalassarchaeaceae archaeon]|nr:hypothetical protein [Candidatus Thalassarchaeaceae archaeon]